MNHVELAIEDYMNALAESFGQDHADRTQVRHTGGADVVIKNANNSLRIVGVGTLRLMSKHMKESSMRRMAA